MSALLEPTTIDFVWTLAATGGLVCMGALALFALPWTDQEIAKMDTAFRSVGEISTETVPVSPLG